MKKILVVDDEEDLCYYVKRILERTGEYTVISTSLPEGAIDLCRSERPDLILVDIVMPHFQGTEIIRQLKLDPELSKILIVVASGQGEMVYYRHNNEWKWQPNRPVVYERGEVVQEHNAQRAAEAYGVDDFLSKPFSPETLIEVLQEVFERKTNLPAPPESNGPETI